MTRTARLGGLLISTLVFACSDDTNLGGGSTGGSGQGGRGQGGQAQGGQAQGGQAQGGQAQGGQAQGGQAQGGQAQGGQAQGGQAQGGQAQGGQAQGGQGQGGQAQGGAGMGGGGTGGGSNVTNDGAPCAADNTCDGGLCLSEATYGLPAGMCSEDCTMTVTCTSSGSSCYQVDPSLSVCLRDCDPAVGCGSPATLACIPVMGAPLGGACVAVCDVNADCTLMGNECQQPPQGYCAPPPPPAEICNNATDDDGDGLIDCGDPDCVGDPSCTSTCDTGVPDTIGSQTCTDCVNCAVNADCQTEANAYFNAPNAFNWSDCVFGNGTPQVPGCPADNPNTMVDEFQVCLDACNTSYPGVEPLYLTAVNCVVCSACPNNCDAANNCPLAL